MGRLCGIGWVLTEIQAIRTLSLGPFVFDALHFGLRRPECLFQIVLNIVPGAHNPSVFFPEAGPINR
jgi:hypothetical protein